MALKFNSSDEIETILVAKPMRWSRTLAARSALRVLPSSLDRVTKTHWMTLLRASFISWAAIGLPAESLAAFAKSSAIKVKKLPALTGDATISAVYSAVYSVSDNHTSVSKSAAFCFAVSAANGSNFTAAWDAFTEDLNWLDSHSDEQSAEFWFRPLWVADAPSNVVEEWKAFVHGSNAFGYDFAPWINWYQALLTCNGSNADYFGPDLTLRIAQQPDEWWDRPAAEVNADIAAWLVQRDEVRIDIPEPEPGTSMGIAGDGRIGIVPTGVSSSDERSQFEGLLEVLGEKADELVESLAGSNAFADLLKVIRKYAEVVRQQSLSIDRLYARGNILENTRAHLQKDIDAGNLPDMPLGVAAGLDSILSMHGSLIASTQVGQQLLDSSHIYEGKAADISVSRSAAREFANAVARSDRLFTDEVREEWPVMADAIGAGRYPERSTQLAMVGNKNVMIALAILVATPVVESAITASIPGALAVGSLKGTIDAAWLFMVSYLPVITNLVQVSGPSLAWMKPVLRLVSRGRG